MSETVTVPEGHLVQLTVASPLPGVIERPGAWIAQLGTASDAIDSELDTVIGEVEALLARPRPRVIVAQAGVLSDLFAPSDPPVMPVDGLLLWVIDATALGSSPALVGRFIDQLRKHRIAQTVFVRDEGTQRARAVIAAIQSCNIGVRTIGPPEGFVLVEVTRPEGVVLSALLGKPSDQMPFAGLEGVLGSVARAPRLRMLLLASDASRDALYAELLAREIPLVLIVQGDGIRLTTWEPGFQALAVFADRGSLLTTARETGLAPDSYKIAEMVPRALFGLAHDRGWAVAINVFTDAGKPLYVAIQPSDVKLLAGL